ncbi:hypothetical protein WMF38_53015 [Sorangium sp. So ce118]
MKDAGLREGEPLLESRSLSSVPVRALAPPLELAVPARAHTFPKLVQRPVIRGHPVVPEVPFEHAGEPCVLGLHGLMPTLAHLFAQARQLRIPLLPRGTTLQLELASPAYAGDVREPQEVERLRACAPVALGVLPGESPEPKHPGLFRVQFQAELREPRGLSIVLPAQAL